jgi:hypothetical protein
LALSDFASTAGLGSVVAVSLVVSAGISRSLAVSPEVSAAGASAVGVSVAGFESETGVSVLNKEGASEDLVVVVVVDDVSAGASAATWDESCNPFSAVPALAASAAGAAVEL